MSLQDSITRQQVISSAAEGTAPFLTVILIPTTAERPSTLLGQNKNNPKINRGAIGNGRAMERGTYSSGLIDDVQIYNREVRP